jgi:hypothetical protein
VVPSCAIIFSLGVLEKKERREGNPELRPFQAPHYAYVDAPDERSRIYRNIVRLPWDQNWNNGTYTSTGGLPRETSRRCNNGGIVSYLTSTYISRKTLTFHLIFVFHLL